MPWLDVPMWASWNRSRGGPLNWSKSCVLVSAGHLCCEDKLRELGLFSLEERRLWGHLIMAFLPELQGPSCKRGGGGLFTRECCDRTLIWRRKGLDYILQRNSSLWGLDCPENLWNSHPWKSSRPGWVGLWLTWCIGRFPAHVEEVGAMWSVRTVPTWTILWL